MKKTNLKKYTDFLVKETETLLTRTERFDFVDDAPPFGSVRYELTPISDPSTTSGSYGLDAEGRDNPLYRIHNLKHYYHCF